ncbi:MAG: MATE family efflux transporter [Thermoplasmata archaeon]
MKVQNTYRKLKSRFSQPTKKEIIEGNVYPVLFKLAWPMMLTTLLNTTYNLVDTVWLGRLSSPENTLSVGAVSLAWPFIFLLLSIEIGLGLAAIALISQHTGAKDYDEARKYTGQLFFLFMVLSVVIAAVAYFVTEDFLNLLTGDGEMVPYAAAYLKILYLGFPGLLIFTAFSFSLRAWGDTLTPTKVMAVSVLLNILLDPLLIFGLGPFPQMGIRGAALGTIIGRYVGMFIAVYLMFGGRVGIKLNLAQLKPDFSRIKKILKIGIPAAIARTEEAFGFVIITGLLAMMPYQEEVLAAYGIGSRVINITFIVLMGSMLATGTMIGQALGANKRARAEEVVKKTMVFMLFFLLTTSVVFIVFRQQIMTFFIPGEPKVIKIGAMYLAILAIGAPFSAFYESVSGALFGSGHTVQQFSLSVTRLWCLRIPMILSFSFGLMLNSTGAWIAITFSNIGAGLLALWIYRMGWWREKIIEKEPGARVEKLLKRFKKK